MSKLVFPGRPPSYQLYDESSLADERKWLIHNVHDPAIFHDGGWYYVFSTDCQVRSKIGKPPRTGLQIRRSLDLVSWEWVGYALDGVPPEARAWSGAVNLWAPEIGRLAGKYVLYYAASRFGSQQSYIGLATSDKVTGPWMDQGEVLKSKPGPGPNAIDPNLVWDEEGAPWLVHGSFFGGVYIVRLDPDTGKPAEPGPGTLLARRSRAVEGAVEGPYIIYHPRFSYYYLFVSFDSLRHNYNIRVGRSKNILGPYVDAMGQALTDTTIEPQSGVGNKVVGGYRFLEDDGWVAPGHNSVLLEGDDCFIVHHARGGRNPRWSYLHVRRVVWSDDGWPLVLPERYAGEYEQPIPPAFCPGAWEYIVLDKHDNEQLGARKMELTPAGEVKGEGLRGCYAMHGANELRLEMEAEQLAQAAGERAPRFCGRILPAWDWERERPCLVYSGINRRGVCLWAKRTRPSV